MGSIIPLLPPESKLISPEGSKKAKTGAGVLTPAPEIHLSD
jgi:hypothetical protein